MAIDVKKLARTHGALVSAVTALAVGLVLLAQSLIEQVVGLLSFLSIAQDLPASQAGAVGIDFLQPFLILALPFAIGFFVSLWIIAPIAEQLEIPHVITRAVLATGVASTVVFIAGAIAAIVNAVGFGGNLFGSSFPFPTFDGGFAASGLGGALSRAVLVFVGALPLGVLAGVLLWQWRKSHPPRHPLGGIIDEV